MQQDVTRLRSAAAGAMRRADGTPLRVLIVEDEPALADVLASMLRVEGWDAQYALDGATAGPGRG